jgi:acyl-CoA thioesterase
VAATDPRPEPGPDPVGALMAADAAARLLGIEAVLMAEGRAVARMVVREDHLNGHGTAHGGVLFTLADTAFACACNSHGPLTVAAGAEITFAAPGRLGDELTAEAVVRTRYGRHGVYDVTVRAGERVIAEFRGRSAQVGRPAG